MTSLLNRYATPFTTGLFVVSLVSGIALFFHLGTNSFRGMHEWLSMVLALPFILHVWKNWRPFVSYFKRPPMAIALGLSLAAAIGFVIPTLSGNAAAGNPQIAAIQAIAGGMLEQVAPLYGHTPESFATALKDKGFTAAQTGLSLSNIATQSGKTDRDLISTLPAIKK